jgi:hypothetical protein
MKIEWLKHNEIDLPAYDRCIESSSFGTVYAMSWYLDAVCPSWELLTAENYRYVMPLPVGRKFGIGYLMQPLFCQQLGVFSIDRLTAEVVERFIAAIPYFFYHIQLNAGNMFGQVSLQTKNNFELDLNRPYREIQKNYSKNFVRNLKKAGRFNLCAIKETDLDTFRNVIENNCDGRPVKGHVSVYFELIRRIKDKAAATVWRVEDEHSCILSAALFFLSERQNLLHAPCFHVGRKGKAKHEFPVRQVDTNVCGAKNHIGF